MFGILLDRAILTKIDIRHFANVPEEEPEKEFGN
jgi:hypothetical protein